MAQAQWEQASTTFSYLFPFPPSTWGLAGTGWKAAVGCFLRAWAMLHLGQMAVALGVVGLQPSLWPHSQRHCHSRPVKAQPGWGQPSAAPAQAPTHSLSPPRCALPGCVPSLRTQDKPLVASSSALPQLCRACPSLTAIVGGVD